MSILQAPSRPAKTTTIEIRGENYEVEPIDPGFAGVAAARVTKLVNGEVYDVVLDLEGLVVCTCPSYVCTFEGTSGTCKHGKALVAAGLLLFPISNGSPSVTKAPSAVAPVTELDRKRASYFGLRIPAAPMAVAEDQVEVLTVEDPGDSWDNWNDQADTPWELGPEAEPIAPTALAPRPNRRRFEPTPAERAEAAWLLRDDTPGSYIVTGRPQARFIHEDAQSEASHAEMIEAVGVFTARFGGAR